MKKRKIPSKNSKIVKKTRYSFKRSFFSFFNMIFLGIKLSLYFCVRSFKKKPKLSLVFLTAFLLSLVVFNLTRSFYAYNEKVLPNSLVLEMSNPTMARIINNDVTSLLNFAKKHHESRSLFLKKLDRLMLSYDKIDQYWIRFGFDRTLQIEATLQIPLFLFQGKGSDTYVVSSKAIILAKNPDPKQYVGLYRVSAPDVKINWKLKAALLKSHAGPTSLAQEYTNDANFPWLIQECRALYGQFQETQIPLTVRQVTWNKATGFHVMLLDVSSRRVVSVQLGKENISKRLFQLKGMLTALAQKNIFPTEIDLDYLDKASFKTVALPSDSFGDAT